MGEQTEVPVGKRIDTRAIALVSGKGGSGKTIVASVLAIADVAPPPDGDGVINILDISFVGSNFTP